MEDDDINFVLLKSLLVRRKNVEKREVLELLRFDCDDAHDVKLVDDLLTLLKGTGCRRYLSLKNFGLERMRDYLQPLRRRSDIAPYAFECLERFHQILKAPIPDEYMGDNGPNIVERVESLTLKKEGKSISQVKLSDPESSVTQGLIVDFSLFKRPLSVEPLKSGTELMNFCRRSGITDLGGFLTDGSYPMALIGHPSSMVAKAANGSAKTVLPENYGPKLKLVVADPDSRPELSAGIRLEGHPAKSDEWKTYQSQAIEELVQTSIGHFQSSYFREAEGAQSWRFYERPPWGLGFLSSACSVVCVFSYEMVGVLLFSIYGGGCSVGTEMYQEYIQILDNADEQTAVVDLKNTQLKCCEVVGKKVQWTLEPAGTDDSFFKVIRYDLFSKDLCPAHGVARGDNWRRIFCVYERYRGLLDNAGKNLPHALLSATLLYGEYQVSQLR